MSKTFTIDHILYLFPNNIIIHNRIQNTSNQKALDDSLNIPTKNTFPNVHWKNITQNILKRTSTASSIGKAGEQKYADDDWMKLSALKLFTRGMRIQLLKITEEFSNSYSNDTNYYLRYQIKKRIMKILSLYKTEMNEKSKHIITSQISK